MSTDTPETLITECEGCGIRRPVSPRNDRCIACQDLEDRTVGGNES